MSKTGVISMGVRGPIIREGDDLINIVIGSVDSALAENGMTIQDDDIIGITESVVARAQGNYIKVDDIVQFLEEQEYPKYLGLYEPIFSRNRFSMMLKGFARYADKIVIYHSAFDTQGDPCLYPNPFTGIDIKKYYTEICNAENCELIFDDSDNIGQREDNPFDVDARCHPGFSPSLAEILNRPVKRADGTESGYNSKWGLLGSNKATEESLKLFPESKKAQKLVDQIQNFYADYAGKFVNVLVYGDGCFKSPEENGVSIWEFADPVTCPAYTDSLNGLPNEIKLKAFADDKYKNLKGEELANAIKQEIESKDEKLVGTMTAQGTTPRRITDLLASLCDLTSGSGDKGTPFILIRNYFKNYASE